MLRRWLRAAIERLIDQVGDFARTRGPLIIRRDVSQRKQINNETLKFENNFN